MSQKFTLFFLIFFMSSYFGFSQVANINAPKTASNSVPKIIRFTRNDFNADPQFLSMCETDDGKLIFGNNDGAIVFDGEFWKKISLPNNSSVYSILKTKDGKIYVGGYNEIGTLQKNNYGNYFYKSLVSDFHLEDSNLENFWDVQELNKHIIYRSFTEIVVITNNRITHLPANDAFLYSGKVGGDYFVYDSSFGIYKFDSNSMSLELFFDAKDFNSEGISSILPTSDPNIVTIITKYGNVYSGNLKTRKIAKKLYLFQGTKKDLVSYAIVGNNSDYVIGTRSSKIFNLSFTDQIFRENQIYSELNNTTVHCLFKTKNNNIWVLQSNGLNLLDYKSPFIKVFDQASVYDILLKDKKIYIATSNGVYFSDFTENLRNSSYDFKKIEFLQGTTWAIQNIDNSIIVSHDSGLYKLENGNTQKIGNHEGFWKILKIKNKPGLYLGTNYRGLYLIENKSNNWSVKNKINGFSESCRDIIADYDSNTYWVCHGYKGVYKIHISSDYSRVDAVDHFTDKNGFKSPFNINVFNWNHKIVFTTNTGIYVYNGSTNKFELFSPLNKILDSTLNTRKIIQTNNKTWFIQDDEAGYFTNNNPKLIKDLFLNLKGSFNRGIESIYPLGDNKVFFGTNMGLYLYTLNETQSQSQTLFSTIISQVSYTHNQKLQFVEISSKENDIQLPNQTDILRIEFSCPKMFSSSEIQYSYKLANIDENWSPWQINPYKEYTHLRPGNYTFVVKSRNLAGLLGKETIYEFNILPKWYQTNFAYFIYFIITGLLVYFIVNYVKNKIDYERLKSKIEAKKTQQLLELEIEQLKLKKDREEIHKDKLNLEDDVLNKSKELANYTLLLSKKKDVFEELKIDLKQLRELLKSDDSRKKISEIFQKLNQHKIGEEFVEIFDVNFEKINRNFFEKLKQIDSTLTKRELRLCAFVKMDLTNKEMASLLNISVRGVESARYRVRKKLNVNQDDHFINFLEKLTQN